MHIRLYSTKQQFILKPLLEKTGQPYQKIVMNRQIIYLK